MLVVVVVHPVSPGRHGAGRGGLLSVGAGCGVAKVRSAVTGTSTETGTTGANRPPAGGLHLHRLARPRVRVARDRVAGVDGAVAGGSRVAH